MKNFLFKTGLLILTFSVCFFFVTWFCDLICKENRYYEEASKEVWVLQD